MRMPSIEEINQATARRRRLAREEQAAQEQQPQESPEEEPRDYPHESKTLPKDEPARVAPVAVTPPPRLEKAKPPNFDTCIYADVVLTETMVDDGVQALRDALKADKIITNKQGEIVGRWPDYANRIKAALSLFKIILTITRGGVSPEEEQAYDYWRERYIQEVGHEPTFEELAQYREVIDIESEETQIRLCSTKSG